MKFSSLIWVITRKCIPGNCFYCNVLKREFNENLWLNLYKNEKEYLEFLLTNLIKFLKKKKINSVRFFGGEPLVCKEILYWIIEKLRKNGFDSDIYLNTNLFLFEKEDIKLIKKFGIKIITSLNGKEDIHIKTRGITKKQYYNLVKNIKLLLKNDIDLQVNIVLFPFDYNMLDNILYVLNLGVKKINLLPLLYSVLLKQVDINKYVLSLKEVVKELINRGYKNYIVNFFNKKSNILPLFQDDLVLDYDGNFYFSMVVLEKYFESFKEILFLGNVKSLDFIDNEIKINIDLVYKILNDKLGKIFLNSLYISNEFSKIFTKFNTK